MKPERKDKEAVQRLVSQAVKDAISFIEDEIAPERDKAAKYYRGDDTLGHEEGRSKVVATKCRDAVRQVKPSLIRVFLQSDKPVEFIPKGEEDTQTAEAQTKYAGYIFNKNGGFRLLNDVIDDALRKKAGVAKIYMTEESETQTKEFELTPDEIALLDGENIEILEHELGADGLHRGTFQKVDTKRTLKMESLPPEEFFIDADARSIDDFYVCGQQREMRVSDFVEMGFDFEEIAELTSDEEPGEEEKETRAGYHDADTEGGDTSMKKVLYTEAYMKADIEGTGVAQLYAFILGGSKYKVLDHYPVDDAPFAIFEIDPEAHTFFGSSLVDMVIADQDPATALLRGILDNVNLTNSPRMAMADGEVNPDDMMNGEAGGLVRTNGTPSDKIMPLVVPFAANEILSATQYFDQVIDNKSGVSRASAGMDPDALRNATATAVDATTRAAMAQPELMARHLAEGGLTRLFRLILRLMQRAGQTEEMVRINGQFVQMQVGDFDPELDVTINVGLGTEGSGVKVSALNQTMQDQMLIWDQYGPDNGLVDMTLMRNTRADILALAGVSNVGRYYKPMTPEIEAQIRAKVEAQASQSQGVDPLVEAEQVKGQVALQKAAQDAELRIMSEQQRMQLQIQKAQADAQIEIGKARQSDDLARDQMLQDGVLQAAELLAKYGVPVDLQALYSLQAQN